MKSCDAIHRRHVRNISVSVRRRGARQVVGWACLLLALPAGHAAPAEYSEYEVKAAFLYKFMSFVEWPREQVPEKDQPYTIGILGTDPFGEVLDTVVRNKTVRGHQIEIVRSEDIAALADCHVLFVSASESERFEDVVEALEDKSVLIVAEEEDAAERGAVISLIRESDRIRLEVNVGEAKKRNLKMNSQLLDVAEVVETEGDRGSRDKDDA